MAIGYVVWSVGGRHAIFLVYILFFVTAWRLLFGGGALLEKEDGSGKRFYQKTKKNQQVFIYTRLNFVTVFIEKRKRKQSNCC